MCEPGKPGLEDHSLTTGHNTSEHRLGTQGGATATTWVHKAALSRGVRQVDFLRLVEGRGARPTASAVHKPCSPGEALLSFSWATGHPQALRINPVTLTVSRKSKQTRTHMETNKELWESAQKLWWPRSGTRCHLQTGQQERRQFKPETLGIRAASLKA